MPENTRVHFGLTQEQLASWLGIPRSSIALAERGHQALPLHERWQRSLRLDLAALGLGLNPAGGPPVAAEPPPPPLPPVVQPLQSRLRECRYRILRLGQALEVLRRKAAPYEARLAALPTLRAWTGPDPEPAQAAAWLDRFEAEAVAALGYVCGIGPQRLLEARIAGFEREAEVLENLLGAA